MRSLEHGIYLCLPKLFAGITIYFFPTDMPRYYFQNDWFLFSVSCSSHLLPPASQVAAVAWSRRSEAHGMLCSALSKPWGLQRERQGSGHPPKTHQESCKGAEVRGRGMETESRGSCFSGCAPKSWERCAAHRPSRCFLSPAAPTNWLYDEYITTHTATASAEHIAYTSANCLAVGRNLAKPH